MQTLPIEMLIRTSRHLRIRRRGDAIGFAVRLKRKSSQLYINRAYLEAPVIDLTIERLVIAVVKVIFQYDTYKLLTGHTRDEDALMVSCSDD